jgi:hypothetical protein
MIWFLHQTSSSQGEMGFFLRGFRVFSDRQMKPFNVPSTHFPNDYTHILAQHFTIYFTWWWLAPRIFSYTLLHGPFITEHSVTFQVLTLDAISIIHNRPALPSYTTKTSIAIPFYYTLYFSLEPNLLWLVFWSRLRYLRSFQCSDLACICN